MKRPAKKAKKTRANRKDAGNLSGVDGAQLEPLLDFMDAHGLEEFEYERGGLYIRLRKASAVSATGASATEVALRRTNAGGGTGEGVSAGIVSSPAEDLHIIKSPMVGTFYAAAGPEAKPFVNAGDIIRERQVVCIIEAMKLMNEIEADSSGEVTSVLVKNGQPVEYGQPLFAVRPAAQKK